jgi:hypothetical protein
MMDLQTLRRRVLRIKAEPMTSKSSKPARAGKAPTRGQLTCEQIGAMFEAVQKLGWGRDGHAMHAIQGVVDSLAGHNWHDATDAAARVADGELPVTASQVAELVVDLRGELDAKHLQVLKRAGALIARAEKARAAEQAVPAPMSRAERDAEREADMIVVAQMELARKRAGFSDGELVCRLDLYLKSVRLRPLLQEVLERRLQMIEEVFKTESVLEQRRRAGRAGVWQPGSDF